MAVVTATQVTVFTDISCSAGTAALALLIPIVQERIVDITHNYFLTDMYVQSAVIFTSAAGTIVSITDFEAYGFQAGDEICIHNSHRNDGFKTIGSVSSTTITVSTDDSVASELSGRTVLIAVVRWPSALAYIAAQMVKYDYDDRPERSIGVTNISLGPYSIGYGTAGFNPQTYGYPQELIDSLSSYTYARVT